MVPFSFSILPQIYSGFGLRSTKVFPLHMKNKMTFYHLVSSSHLNAHGTLHGGELLKWIDEDAGTHAHLLNGGVNATRIINTISFDATGRLGDVIQIDTEFIKSGRTSLTLKAIATHAVTGHKIAETSDMVFVHIDKNHVPAEFKLKD